MEPVCFPPSHPFNDHVMASDLYKPSFPAIETPKSVRMEPSRPAEPTRIISDPVTGRSYSKGRLLGKVRAVYLQRVGRVSPDGAVAIRAPLCDPRPRDGPSWPLCSVRGKG